MSPATRSTVLLTLLLLALSPWPGTSAASPSHALTTHAERTGFTRTGRYAEVAAMCEAFARAYPDTVRCFDFGTSPEGRPMKALAISQAGALEPTQARTRKLPVVLVQGGIHPGEADGKDAGFLALRQVLEGKAAAGALDRLVWLLVPVFNVDGHERFEPWNRPNQRGPEESGWRATAQNLNLNRDYAKADSPEMQAMLQLVNAWDPLLQVDLHATNGAQFEHDIAVQVEPLHAGDEALREVGRTLRDGVMADLAAQGSLPLPFYPSLAEYDNPGSGFVDGVYPPRFSTGYFLLRNRLSMLVETHSWKPYAERVRTTRNTIVSVLEHVARHGEAWLAAAAAADERALALGGQEVPLDYEATDRARTIDFRGYAWTRTPSDISGALATRYDETTPQLWRVPLRDEVVPARSERAPLGGYVVPTAHASWMAAHLRLHGLQFTTLAEAMPGAEVETFRASSWTPAAASLEGRQRMALEGGWSPEQRDIPAGSLFVPIAQPSARLVVALMEPLAPDSHAAWGRFNAHFERKEYMEAYVAEAVAREMLAADPGLEATFRKKLGDDPEFADSPRARLDFFYRRHPAWDERLGLYPVYRAHWTP
ncbi:M14 family metallopeptidase [Luteimonas sp. JM171]|uniref:M14 family metallopeptidase n=1 Tax=Luteimonas sp. JM171 TaxID=1896164 RepID=UPI00085678C6|nr:M14 family metallopeptidase [Luteimonas sp. JM171]AOH37174.1 peptidase M14 [Luteimonas sp. JM171]